MLRALVFLVVCLAAPPLRADSARVEIGGATIALSPPTGYCALDRSVPVHRQLIEAVERIVATTNRVLLSFADCGQLEEYTDRRRVVLDDFGQYMTPLRAGRAEVDPAAFSQQMTELLKSQGAQLVEGASALVRRRVEAMRTGVRMGENRMIGVLRTDQRASYLGVVQNLALPGGASKIQLGVVAFGLLKQRVVTLNLYTRFEGSAANEETLARLLGVSAATYAATAAGNGQ
jgi:hypothetical protein